MLHTCYRNPLFCPKSKEFFGLLAFSPIVANPLFSRVYISRGDWMGFELFVRGVEAWDEDVKRLVMAA